MSAIRKLVMAAVIIVTVAPAASGQDCPEPIGFLDTPGSANDVAVAGGYAYIAERGQDVSGLRIVDVSTPSTPADVGFVATLGDSFGVAVAGGYAFLAAGEAGLRVFNLSQPSTPVEVGFVDTPEGAYEVVVSGDYAYVTDWGAGLRVIDVTTPSAPVEVGFVDTPSQAKGLAVSGGYAYVADENGVLRIIDVSLPSAPVEVGFLQTPSFAEDVAVLGTYAFVAASNSGLRVIDVSTPSAPVEVGFVGVPGAAHGVAVHGSYAYVADFSNGLRVIDISVPSAPVEVGSHQTPGHALRITVSGGYVFVADMDAGLSIFRDCAGGVLPDGRVSFVPAAAVAAGAQGAFFQTDLEINNKGAEEAQVTVQWLPRGQDNSEPAESEPISLAPGQSLRYENVLTELFGLEPDSVGALKLVASTESVIGMSRTYNVPGAKIAGTFGQGLPAIPSDQLIPYAQVKRLIFMSENNDTRANVGCVNGLDTPVHITLELFDSAGTLLAVKTMNLGPWSNNQINRIFGDDAPVNGYVDVSTQTEGAAFYCYGSVLDNLTSDPTTVLPQTTSGATLFIPAVALAAGLEGAFFQTDVDLNNAGGTPAQYELGWLPRGADNSDPTMSDPFTLAAGASVRYENVLAEIFGLEPDQVGALVMEADSEDLLAMSRTYNLPGAKIAGTFGQELPGIPADQMIPTGVKKRIIFMNENDDVRSNVGCQNAGLEPVTVKIELHNADGERLGTRTMELPPLSNDQATRVFRNHAPISAGYVDVWTDTEGASIYCYGSVLDNSTSDPTTVLPQ